MRKKSKELNKWDSGKRKKYKKIVEVRYSYIKHRFKNIRKLWKCLDKAVKIQEHTGTVIENKYSIYRKN